MKALRVFLALSLTSCALQFGPPAPDAPAEKERALCDTKLRYCIEPPEVFVARGWTDNWVGLSGAETAHTVSNGLVPDDPHYIRLDFYHSSPSPHCGNIGVSEPTVVGDPAGEIKIMRGKVDFFERYGSDYEPGTEPQCRPYGGGAAYVLCSEKNGKTVLICISEVTDDPALAEGVFDTFRWLP